MRDDTTLRVKKSTAERLQKLGDLSDTYDTLLNAMADYIEDHENDWWEEEEIDEDPDEDSEEEIHDVGELAS